MLSLICEVDFKEDDDFRLSKSYSNLVQNNHFNVLINIPFYDEFVSFSKKIFSQSFENDHLMMELKNFVCSKIDNLNQNDVLSVAISCLQSFAFINWLGPVPVQFSTLKSELKNLDIDNPSDSLVVLNLIKHFSFNSQEYEKYQETTRSLLNLDGETLFQIVKCPHLLLLSKLIFLDNYDKISAINKLSSWWTLRLIFLYQQLFEEKSSTLKEKVETIIKEINQFFDPNSQFCLLPTYGETFFKVATIVFNLEVAHLYYQSYNWTLGQECFKKAIQLANLDIELIGVFGKRTRYQQKDLAQLFAKIKNQTIQQNLDCTNLDYLNKDFNLSELPKDLVLNDDTILNKIKVSNLEQERELEESRKFISQLELVVLYCSMFDFYKNNPKHELTKEEMSSLIELLLSNPSNWCVQASTLLMRTKLEADSVRRMERSLQQLENLVDHYRQPHDKPEAKFRYQYFYSIAYQPFWAVLQELCKFYMQLGLINSSLDIYTNLKMWDDAIKCLVTLDKRDQAEQLIRQQLGIKETADLYCSLGEVTRELDHFYKAIEISKGRSARAYRVLAKHLFFLQKYDEAVNNFEKSLGINYLQYDAWFMLGNAAFRSEKWETAVKAFRVCTNLDPENHETWNNMAASYTKLGQKDKAHFVFQEAIKYDYENWKIWENYLWTSIDCGYFNEAIKAYNRLLDLKQKYVDVDVLRAFCSAFEKKVNDAYNESIFKYKKKVLELFGRISSLVVTEWQVYWNYAEIVRFIFQTDDSNNNISIELNQESSEKYFSLLLKAFRNLINKPNWDLSLDSCKEVIDTSIDVLSRCNEFGKKLQNPRDTFGSLNLSVRSIMSKLKIKYQVDPDTSDQYLRLLFLKDLNNEFVVLQKEYNHFLINYFS